MLSCRWIGIGTIAAALSTPCVAEMVIDHQQLFNTRFTEDHGNVYLQLFTHEGHELAQGQLEIWSQGELLEQQVILSGHQALWLEPGDYTLAITAPEIQQSIKLELNLDWARYSYRIRLLNRP